MFAMHNVAYIERLVNLLDPTANVLLNMSYDDAVACVGTGDPQQVRQIDGQFALLHQTTRQFAWRGLLDAQCATSLPNKPRGPV